MAGPVAAAFGEPTVAPLLIALGGILVISVLGAIHIALMLREFGHRAMATPVGGEQRGGRRGGAGGGECRLGGLEPGGAAGGDRGGGNGHGLACLPVDARAAVLDPRCFGSWRDSAPSMTLTQILFVALVRVQDVIIGRTIGTAAVGVYRTAWRTVELIAQGVIMPFSQVALPTLGRLQDDLPAFRKAYLRIIGVSAALAFPAIIGFAVLAPSAIPFVFGDQWEESARIAQLLGFMVVPFTLNRFAGPALATLGQSGWLAKIAGLQLALTVVMTLAAAPYGLLAIAAAYVAPGLSGSADPDVGLQEVQRTGLR